MPTVVALMAMLLTAVPSFAATAHEGGQATVTFNLSLSNVPQDSAAAVFYSVGGPSGPQKFHLYCGHPEGAPAKAANCEAKSYSWTQKIAVGTKMDYIYAAGKNEDATVPGNLNYFHQVEQTISGDMVVNASFDYSNLPPMVTKTLKFTINGQVSSSQVFAAFMSPFSSMEGNSPPLIVIFCGSIKGDPAAQKPACQGNGTVYTAQVRVPVGDTMSTFFLTADGNNPNAEPKPFHQVRETFNSDMTNTAWYNYPSMPSTGGGGMAQSQPSGNDDRIPVGVAMVALGLLGFAVTHLRRHVAR